MISFCINLSIVCYILAATCAVAIVRDLVYLETVGACDIVLAISATASFLGLAQLWSLATRCEVAKAARS